MAEIELNEIELKPCPFCGGKAQIRPLKYSGKDPVAAISGRVIACTQCFVELAVSWACNDPMAAEAWNRRAAERHGQWGKLKGGPAVCTNCKNWYGNAEGKTDKRFYQKFRYCPFCGAKMDGKDGEQNESLPLDRTVE